MERIENAAFVRENRVQWGTANTFEGETSLVPLALEQAHEFRAVALLPILFHSKTVK